MPNIKINADQAVPIVVTETTIYREPEIKRERAFRGLQAGLTSLMTDIGAWAWARVQESFFDETVTVVDPGKKSETHFAIIVGSDGYERVLQAVETEHKPPCVHHYEIVRYAEDEREKAQASVAAASASNGRKFNARALLDPKERQARLARIQESMAQLEPDAARRLLERLDQDEAELLDAPDEEEGSP